MTATSYIIRRIINGLGFSFAKDRLHPVYIQEKRLLSRLYIELGSRLWRSMKGLKEIADTYAIMERLVKNGDQLAETISALEEEKLSLQKKDTLSDGPRPVTAQYAVLSPERDKRDKILMLTAQSMEKEKELAELQRTLGEEDPLCVSLRRSLTQDKEQLESLRAAFPLLAEEMRKEKQSLQSLPDSFTSVQTIVQKIQTRKNKMHRVNELLNAYFKKTGLFIVVNRSVLKHSQPEIRKEGRLLALIQAVEKSCVRLDKLTS